MNSRGWLLVRILLGAIAATLALSPTGASAALTSSNISTPSDQTHLFSDDVAGTDTTTISGTASGSAAVDIVCYFASSQALVADNVSVSGGTFSTSANLDNFVGEKCRLRAIEDHSAPPPDTTNFTGPVVSVSGQRSTNDILATGPNAGVQYDYYIASILFGAGQDYDSAGSCGLDDSYLFNDLSTTSVFYCNGYVPDIGEPGTRAPLTIDGSPAYSPPAAFNGNGSYFAGFRDLQPFPSLTYSYHLDHATEDLTINETDHFVFCAPDRNTFKPTSTSCTSFVQAPVKLDRTIVADHAQQQTRIFDRWSVTDGHSHVLSAQYENAHCLGPGSCSSNIGFRLPGEAGYTHHSAGQVIQGPFAEPASIFVKDTTAADGDPAFGQGVGVYSSAPNDVTFHTESVSGDSYMLDYDNRTIPAQGSVDLSFGYFTALTTGELTGPSHQLEDEFGTPQVKITSPATGSFTADRPVVVTGTATDNVGVTSFTVNGKAVALGSGGSFSTPLKLGAGRSTITAVAKDAAGNSGQAQSTVIELLAKTGKPHAKSHHHKVVVDVGEALACPAGGPKCKAKLIAQKAHKLSAAKKAKPLGKGSVTAKAGKRGELILKLTKKGRKALNKKGSLRLTLRIDIRVGKGPHVTTTRTFKVKRP